MFTAWCQARFCCCFLVSEKNISFHSKNVLIGNLQQKKEIFQPAIEEIRNWPNVKIPCAPAFRSFLGKFFSEKNDWPDIIYCRRLGGCFELSPIFTFGFFAKIWGAMFCQAIKKWRVWACGGKKPPMRQFFCKKPFLGYSFPLLEVGSECGWLPSTPVAMQKKHHTIVVPPKKHRWKIFEILHKDVRKKQLSESCFTWKISGRALLVQLCYIFLEAFWMADFSWVW